MAGFAAAPASASATTPLSLSGSSFYAAMRVLPRAQRSAMFEIYRFCRAVDDVADGGGSRSDRLSELAGWRDDIEALFAGKPPARLRDLEEPVRTFALQRDDFLAIVDGMEMDVATDIRAPDLATLDLYCDRVACAVGRLCVRVFGVAAPGGETLAANLGRALQLTNILRDLDEDAAKGRLYLPREALRAARIAECEPLAVLMHPALGVACRHVAELATAYFDDAEKLMAGEPSRRVRAPRVMAKVYERVLRGLVARGWTPPRTPVRLGRGSILGIALRETFVTAILP